MLIDWFTVGAQALNFLILVWLMKRFLYQPILNAIDAREKRIAKELADADAKKAEAQKEHDEFQHKNEEFDQQRAALLGKATEEAKAERQRLLDEARKAADALSAKQQETLRNDVQNLNQTIRRRTQEEVFAITRKALTDLATTSLEERASEVFTRRLRAMDDPAKAGLGDALKKMSEPALVRSAFDLPAEQRAAIQNALNETFSADIHLRFETAPDLVSGIELTSNGQKVAWSIADYLASMEKGIGELLKQQNKPEPKPAPKPDAKTEADAKPESKPEAKSEPKPDSKPPTPARAASEVKSEPAPKAGPTPKSETEVKAKPKKDAEPDAEAKTQSKPAAKAAPEGKTEPANPKAEAAPEPAPKPDAKPAPQPEAETKAEPTPEAEPKAEAKPPSKPEAKVEPGANPAEPTKVTPEVKAETPKPKTAATPAPAPEAKAEPAAEAEVAPAPAAKPETKATAKPDSEATAKPEPEAAPAGS